MDAVEDEMAIFEDASNAFDSIGGFWALSFPRCFAQGGDGVSMPL